MRIIIASPPKTGNVWVKCLLAEIYGLRILGNEPRDEKHLQASISSGWFKDNAVFHQHFWPTADFLNIVESLQCSLVTTIRNPYDTFVSLYYFVQNFPDKFGKPQHPLYPLYGKPITHGDVINFIEHREKGFGRQIVFANEWKNSDKSILIRYEDLHESPRETLNHATNQIVPVQLSAIQSAISECSATNMRKKRKSAILSRVKKGDHSKHIRKAKVGDWKNHLTEKHLEAFRIYGSLIENLGYEVL